MCQPEDFERGESGGVLLLNKALYRLKQASCVWKQKLTQILYNELGFNTVKSDSSIYIGLSEGLQKDATQSAVMAALE
jgi:hypothetical protein